MHAPSSEFYVGVECGYNNVTLCEALIDKVENYTNLFIIGSTGIVENSTLLNEVCDYAYKAGLHFAVYFSPNQVYQDLGQNVSLAYPNGTIVPGGTYQSTLPLAWLNSSMAKYGDNFLGAYVFDEPGGNQLDSNVQRIAKGETSYLNASNDFVQRVNSDIEPYLNSGVMTFTADYCLYWFDYTAGYNMVLAELGLNNNPQLQISLCRGAATAQNKPWGVIVTYNCGSSGNGTLESGPQLYNDLVYSYDSGATYAVVFDYAQTTSGEPSQPCEYGILNDTHFTALKNFWSYVETNPGKHDSLKADVALVLPEDLGLGFRGSEDNVWGIFNADYWSETIFSDVIGYVNQYGYRLDIVYNDPAFNNAVKTSYSTVIQWTSNEASENFPVINVNTTLGYATIQEAINSGATSDGDVISVGPGIYYENIVVNRTLTIIAQEGTATIIDGGTTGTCVDITSSNVTFSGFTIRNSGVNASSGICLDSVGNCSILDNTVTANYYGIYLNCSENDTLRNNEMNDNIYNLEVDGNESANFINYIDNSNTVNDKTVYYLVDDNNLDINPSTYPDAGYIALVNCTNVTEQDLNLSNNGNGILLVDTQNSKLTGNDVANTVEGIQLIDSEGNTLRNNTLSNNSNSFWVQGGYSNDVDASNTMNGEVICYWVNQHDKTVPSDSGCVVLADCSGITVHNLDLANNLESIVLSSTSNTTINQNQISNSYYGITLEDSSNGNNITNNTVSNNEYGIYCVSSSYNTLSENSITANTNHGMLFTSNCDNNTLTGNQINSNTVAVEFTNSSNNAIIQNNLTGNIQSIQVLGESNNSFITENFITDSTCGIEVGFNDAFSPNSPSLIAGQTGYAYPFSSPHNITQNTLINNTWGILVNSANDVSIVGNTITGSDYGIDLGGGFTVPYFQLIIAAEGNSATINDTLEENTVTSTNMVGIDLASASNCSVTGNTVANGQTGISISSSPNNLLAGNIVSDNKQFGVQLSGSSAGNTLRNNTLVSNNYSFDDESINYNPGSHPAYSVNDVDASNNVNGKPIIYWVGQSNKTVPSNAALVILVNCTNITVQNLNVTGEYVGVLLAYTNNSTVTGNNVQGNNEGIMLLSSSYNAIKGNQVISNEAGISLTQEILITFGTTPAATPEQVTFPSTCNIVSENTIKSNVNGVAVGGGYSDVETSRDVSGNIFYENDFINNTSQVTPPFLGSGQSAIAQNSWDNGIVGNYWSDYESRYPNASELDSSGSWNTQYMIDADNIDHYPLMAPFNVSG
jgi:parallel beta-helix repeat protein